ncbi:MAG: guanylate kinase [Gammaproteobacteria bacterium]|jgi:guanylate kinase
MTGKLIIISAPSGAGKTTLVHALDESDPKILVSISHTTRPKRHGEVEGIAYFFTDEKSFKAMADNNQFLEHAIVFDNYYGTSKNWVEARLSEGYDVILEIDWQGAAMIRQLMPDCVSIFILPPSIEALESRLAGRDEDDTSTIQRRMHDAISELSHHDEYDYSVINDEFAQALFELQDIVAALRDDKQFQQVDLSQFIAGLMAET